MKTILMFPGQGSQQCGMGEELFSQFPEETAMASACLGYDVRALCVEEVNSEKLQQTRYTQPLLFFVNALSEVARRRNGEAPGDIFIGHSLGEYNALHASGVFSLEDGLRLVKRRGEAMEHAGLHAPAPGGMLAVLGLEESVIEDVIKKTGQTKSVTVANLNAPRQIILSGIKEDLRGMEADLKIAGARKCVALKVSGAFHSSFMEEAAHIMEAELAKVTLQAPRKPVIANLTAEGYPEDADGIRLSLVKQITHKVRWSETLQKLMQSGEEYAYHEVGPGKVLTGLLRRHR